MLVSILNAVFFTAFGLTLFGLPFCMFIAQIAALILGIVYIVQCVNTSRPA